MKRVPVKQLLIIAAACLTGWFAYVKLRKNPQVAGRIDEVERQSLSLIGKAGEMARSTREQVTATAADMAESATTGANGVTTATEAKGREVLDAAAGMARQVIAPVREKLEELIARHPEE